VLLLVYVDALSFYKDKARFPRALEKKKDQAFFFTGLLGNQAPFFGLPFLGQITTV
jgi:hypothetical protein